MNTRHEQNINIDVFVVINVSSVFVFSDDFECEKGHDLPALITSRSFTYFLTGLYLLTDDSALK